MDDCRVFAYIDGIPTKGCWIDIDELTDDSDVRSALAEVGVFDDQLHAEVDDLDAAREELAENYGGDILVADAEGLARQFLGSYGTFDWDEFKVWAEFLDSHSYVSEDVVCAYLDWIGSGPSTDNFEESYCGTYRSAEDWAEEFMSDVYDIPDNLSYYIDYAKFARDCSMDGYYFVEVGDGVAVFRSI